MSPFTFIDLALTPGLALLPKRMDSPAARAMVMAICLQESDLQHRRQVKGPARGYAQFELAGVAGVLTHRASQAHAAAVLQAFDYGDATTRDVQAALEHNDLLTVVFARLLLWTLPQPLCDQHDYEGAWAQYIDAWRPGRPHPEKWRGAYGVGWDLVQP